MDRRHFLAGVIGGPIAGGLLLRTTPEASAVLVPNTPVLVASPSRGVPGIMVPDMDPYLYNRRGEPVAFIESFTMTRESIDVTAWGDQWKRFMPGLQRVDIRAVGVPDLVIEIETDRIPTLDHPRYEFRKRR